jgi:hypothetical protein
LNGFRRSKGKKAQFQLFYVNIIPGGKKRERRALTTQIAGSGKDFSCARLVLLSLSSSSLVLMSLVVYSELALTSCTVFPRFLAFFLSESTISVEKPFASWASLLTVHGLSGFTFKRRTARVFVTLNAFRSEHSRRPSENAFSHFNVFR